MREIGIWLVFGLVIMLLMTMNRKQIFLGSVRKASRCLRTLTERFHANQSTEQDLEQWEQCLHQLERHPNEYNKLDRDIGLMRTFAQYVEKHYPLDPRLPELKEAASWQQDSIWGIRLDKQRK